MICGIYKITAQDGKIYIGKSRDIQKRWDGYRSTITKLKTQPDLYISFKKYGWFNHTFEIVEECAEEDLSCRELFWQHYYEVLGENGLNMLYSSCKDVDFQLNLFNLKNGFFRRSVILHLYKHENIKNVNFNIKKFRNRKKLVNKKEKVKPLKSVVKIIKGSKIVIDTQTGVFYYSLKEVCILYNLSYTSMRKKLSGRMTNTTNFLFA